MAPESAARLARAAARAEVVSRIVGCAREQLREHGPGELSLRAIARELGMPSSGIYRYVTGRDELLTALLVEVRRSGLPSRTRS